MEATPTQTVEQEQAAHHDTLAQHARTNAETYRSYLTWSTDPAQRRWADLLADACDRTAEAEAEYATALRERVPA